MSSTIATDLFAVMEKQMGAEAARAAAAAYLANSQGSAAPTRPPMSAEHKAKLKAGREAALAKKAAEKAAGASSPEEPAAEKAPRPPMSEEHKAKLKAGREAALAKKAAEKAAGAPAAAPSPPAEPKKRGPKPLKDMNAEELAVHKAKVVARAAAKALVGGAAPAAAAPSPSHAADPTVFAPFTHKGVSYLRNSRGDLLTPEYEWVGRYDGKAIDTKFPKPADLEDEGSAADE